LRQFDVYENPSARSRAVVPYVVVLQSHLLSAMPTVVIAPMVRENPTRNYTRTSARIAFQGEDLMVSVAELVAVDERQLQGNVGSVAEHEDEIRRAIDAVFTGF
jgi:toxin CcdB